MLLLIIIYTKWGEPSPSLRHISTLIIDTWHLKVIALKKKERNYFKTHTLPKENQTYFLFWFAQVPSSLFVAFSYPLCFFLASLYVTCIFSLFRYCRTVPIPQSSSHASLEQKRYHLSGCLRLLRLDYISSS